MPKRTNVDPTVAAAQVKAIKATEKAHINRLQAQLKKLMVTDVSAAFARLILRLLSIMQATGQAGKNQKIKLKKDAIPTIHSDQDLLEVLAMMNANYMQYLIENVENITACTGNVMLNNKMRTALHRALVDGLFPNIDKDGSTNERCLELHKDLVIALKKAEKNENMNAKMHRTKGKPPQPKRQKTEGVSVESKDSDDDVPHLVPVCSAPPALTPPPSLRRSDSEDEAANLVMGVRTSTGTILNQMQDRSVTKEKFAQFCGLTLQDVLEAHPLAATVRQPSMIVRQYNKLFAPVQETAKAVAVEKDVVSDNTPKQ